MRSSLNPVVSYRILNPLQGGTSIRPYGPGTSRDCSAVTHQPSSQAEPGSSAPDRVSHRFTTFAKPLSPTRRLQRLPLLFFTHLNRLTLHHVNATWRYVGLPWEQGAIVVYNSVSKCRIPPEEYRRAHYRRPNATITPPSRGSWS